MSGFTNPENNGSFRVVGLTSTKIMVNNTGLVTESAGNMITITDGILIQNWFGPTGLEPTQETIVTYPVLSDTLTVAKV